VKFGSGGLGSFSALTELFADGETNTNCFVSISDLRTNDFSLSLNRTSFSLFVSVFLLQS
jgi:hypothetical protein